MNICIFHLSVKVPFQQCGRGVTSCDSRSLLLLASFRLAVLACGSTEVYARQRNRILVPFFLANYFTLFFSLHVHSLFLITYLPFCFPLKHTLFIGCTNGSLSLFAKFADAPNDAESSLFFIAQLSSCCEQFSHKLIIVLCSSCSVAALRSTGTFLHAPSRVVWAPT